MDEDNPPSARALLPCLLPLDTLKKIRDQNLLVLEPVGTLKDLCHAEEMTEPELFLWKKYRLHGKPQSLKEFLELFLLENGEYDKDRAILIPDCDAFVCMNPSQVQRDRLPRAYQEGVLEVGLSSGKHRYQILYVFSSTFEQAMPCLEFLFGLNDCHFQNLGLCFNVPEDDEGELPICPLTNRCLETLLQNEKRENKFYNMAFTPEQSRVLATSGTHIGLSDCNTPDGGVAFVDAARQHSSLTKLTLWGCLPFDDRNFACSLDHLNLEYLGLSNMTLHGESCRAVAATEINYLHLVDCKFEDEEAVQVLVDNVRAERGPQGLSLEGEPFESPEMPGEFMNALRGNTYLKRLDIGYLYCDGSFPALVAALSENRGLIHLGLKDCDVDDRCWDKLMGAIAGHPSLRTLSFEEIKDEDDRMFLKRHEPMHSLAGMLAENEQVDEIQVETDSFDRDVWNAVVVPRLEINSYRKQFRAIQAIRLDKTRAAVVARALARIALADLKSESSLIFLVLSQNCDVFCSYLDESLTRDNHISVPSRKRSR
jgi:hypothetical protein